ncbi:DUF6691 family protein [Bosea sp. 124]|uniref:DUF6691 family protein n=1 Tax=Bosea sp. 124 TaxID=2135642 RepID=UPI000D3B7FEC|nr:DUF6691 family protein [Bosea sp. 124]PTM43479.1 hypothetical protein C8D03_5095 [Bosea sp. 124]
MPVLLQFLTGLVFGVGLLVAGMSDPAKVLNFLDLAAIPAGTWDASLAFVMAGGIAVAFIGFRLVLKRPHPVFAERYSLPTATAVDTRILAGPAIFGIGWGLAGFCPGPALTALGYGTAEALVFILAMLAGMAAARRLARTQGTQALLPRSSS